MLIGIFALVFIVFWTVLASIIVYAMLRAVRWLESQTLTAPVNGMGTRNSSAHTTSKRDTVNVKEPDIDAINCMLDTKRAQTSENSNEAIRVVEGALCAEESFEGDDPNVIKSLRKYKK